MNFKQVLEDYEKGLMSVNRELTDLKVSYFINALPLESCVVTNHIMWRLVDITRVVHPGYM